VLSPRDRRGEQPTDDVQRRAQAFTTNVEAARPPRSATVRRLSAATGRQGLVECNLSGEYRI
jgi:hypothetical protein